MPAIQANADGWGPTAGVDPEKFNNIPYSPFNKGDRLGRVADWVSSTTRPGRYNQFTDRQAGQGGGTFGFHYDDDAFQVVDTKPAQRPQHFGPRRHVPHTHRRDSRQFDSKNQLNLEGQKAIRREQDQARRRQNKRYGASDSRWDARPQQRTRDSSVDVGSGWRVVEQINFPILLKLKCKVDEPETVRECGQVLPYDKQYERLTAKTCKQLERLPQEVAGRRLLQVTASDDPIMQKYADEDAAQIFATDQVLGVLMASPRSVYSWDIVATKTEDGKIWLDKRPNSVVDYITVNETANEPPSDEREGINNVGSLSQEATVIGANISQMLVQKKVGPLKMPNPNPFEEAGQRPLSIAYRYRKFDMDGLSILVRTEVDTYVEAQGGKPSFIKLCVLNEFDPRVSGSVDWRRKLDTQKGAVLAAELKNNSNKLAMWTSRACMAGVDHIKMGFVSRVHPKQCYDHSILQVQPSRTTDFARQINLDMDNCWGIVKGFCDLVAKQEPGKYVLLKDPNKPLVRIYSVPENAFDAVVEAVEDENVEDIDYDDDFAM